MDDPGKTQLVRIADVFLIGPAMVAGGLELTDTRPRLGWFLVASGVATVVYNARNYLRIARR
jgi:hypothetical protein